MTRDSYAVDRIDRSTETDSHSCKSLPCNIRLREQYGHPVDDLLPNSFRPLLRIDAGSPQMVQYRSIAGAESDLQFCSADFDAEELSHFRIAATR